MADCRYGFVTNTKIKIIIAVDSMNSLLRDNEIRAMFRKLHNAYTELICNPFYVPGDPIVSKSVQMKKQSVGTDLILPSLQSVGFL